MYNQMDNLFLLGHILRKQTNKIKSISQTHFAVISKPENDQVDAHGVAQPAHNTIKMPNITN